MKQRTQVARKLRRHATDAERLLWNALREAFPGTRFRRQHPIGRYVVDFACPAGMLAIEIDGGQHAMNEPADIARTAEIARLGYRVIRFWNNEVIQNLSGVLEICGIFPREEPVYYPDKIIRVRLTPQLKKIGSFFEAAVNSGTTRKFIDGEIKTTAGQHGISGASLKRAPIPIPPITEAKRILELLRDDHSRAKDMETLQAADLQAAAALRQSVLKSAFEGRLVPQNPADEPASALLAGLRNSHPAIGARRRRARAAANFSHPSLPSLSRQPVDPRVEPAGDE